MNTKNIEAVLPAPPPHMVGDGFRVHNYFPNGYKIGVRRMSPFFLLDYNSKIEFPPSDKPRGVDVHPHRGFETVTIAYHGRIAHNDSAGNSGVIGEGDVQWMTAARGILHKEFHEENFSRKGGLFQMIQLWVNLPAKYKMSEPRYQDLQHDKLGKYSIQNDGGIVNVIAGELNGVKGAAKTFTPIEVYDIRLKANKRVDLDLPAGQNTGALVVEGSVAVNGETAVQENQFVLFENKGTAISLEAGEDAIILLLSGEPINEPLVQYGPFLMNTQQEIQEAIADYGLGRFGTLD